MIRARIGFCLIAIALLASGVAAQAVEADASSKKDLFRLILDEIKRTQATEFAWQVVLWTSLGAFAGALLAIGAFFSFRSLGWYRTQWRHGGWAQVSIAILTTAACAVLMGLVGMWQGVLRGSESVLTQSRLATDVFPLVGNAVADSVAWLDHLVTREGTNAAVSRALEERSRAFRAGEWEWNVPAFLKAVDRFRGAALKDLTAKTVDGTLAEYPQLKGTLGEFILRQVLAGFMGKLDEAVAGQAGIAAGSREQLLAEARREGNPETIGYAELSALVVDRGIVPSILVPLRATARPQQLVLVVLCVFVVVSPAGLFWLITGRKAPAGTPASAPPSMTESRS